MTIKFQIWNNHSHKEMYLLWASWTKQSKHVLTPFQSLLLNVEFYFNVLVIVIAHIIRYKHHSTIFWKQYIAFSLDSWTTGLEAFHWPSWQYGLHVLNYTNQGPLVWTHKFRNWWLIKLNINKYMQTCT